MTEIRPPSRDVAERLKWKLSEVQGIPEHQIWDEISPREIYMKEAYRASRKLFYSFGYEDRHRLMKHLRLSELVYLLSRDPDILKAHRDEAISIKDSVELVKKIRKIFKDDSTLAWLIFYNRLSGSFTDRITGEKKELWASLFGNITFSEWIEKAGQVGLTYDETKSYYDKNGGHSKNMTPEVIKYDLDDYLMDATGSLTATV